MGLDNGFVVMSNKRKITREDLPKGIIYPFNEDYESAPEIVYWRKNWGLRNAVLDKIGNQGRDNYHYEINTPEQLFEIVHVIFSFMDEKVWEDEGQSIWSYDEVKPRLMNDIFNLILMIPFMRVNPDVYLEFYDSY